MLYIYVFSVHTNDHEVESSVKLVERKHSYGKLLINI